MFQDPSIPPSWYLDPFFPTPSPSVFSSIDHVSRFIFIGDFLVSIFLYSENQQGHVFFNFYFLAHFTQPHTPKGLNTDKNISSIIFPVSMSFHESGARLFSCRVFGLRAQSEFFLLYQHFSPSDFCYRTRHSICLLWEGSLPLTSHQHGYSAAHSSPFALTLPMLISWFISMD